MADADPKIEKTPAEAIVIEPATQTEPVQEATEPRAKRSWLRPLLMFGVPLIILAIVGFFWLTSGRFASTDNAYVQHDKVSVSAEVAGRIVKVAVRENQRVRKGDLLFEIDPAPIASQWRRPTRRSPTRRSNSRRCRPAMSAPAPTSRPRATASRRRRKIMAARPS
ncbi:biotin/lipoyl-binding protein [Sphingomonas sp. 7/4-4]|uniref:biotin/lipoyl-binding protein n=1 Tax=Sphingomonas sp. 7/4-4 TaxID=3018446 RepID=UPI0022F3CF27|nr:biotin/lipoyl-binding protein [Sphingomonas sp. 7/4-4]WBY08472.1 biotin/lipoyl-binding protein [Sphingomonas sp. 7/4-4]